MLRNKRKIAKVVLLFSIFLFAGILSWEVADSMGIHILPGSGQSTEDDSVSVNAGLGSDNTREGGGSGQSASQLNQQQDQNTSSGTGDEQDSNVDNTTADEGTEGSEGAATDKNDTQNASDNDSDQQDQTPVSIDGFSPKIENCEITIPGVEKSYEFLYLSDNHIIVTSDEDSQQVLDNALPRKSQFVDGDSGLQSADEFSKWIDYANANKVDRLLLGGDLIDFPSSNNLSFIRSQLGRLNLPYLYTLGNHDWTYPWEYFTETALTEYRPLFKEFMKDNTAGEIVEYDDFLLVTVDDSEDQIDPDSLTILETAFAKNKPIILMMHVPFDSDTVSQQSIETWGRDIAIGNNGIRPNTDTTKFINMVCQEDSPVVAILAGHVHFQDTSQITDTVTQYITGPGYEGYGILIKIKGN